MSSIWDIIGIKKGPGGCGNVTQEQKNSIISDAVSKWTEMGLSQEQIAFGIATMGVESGFNPSAKSTSPESPTEYGLGQWSDDTWAWAVSEYNNNTEYGGNFDAIQSRNDAAAQIAVMGAWIDKVWTMAQSVVNNPRLKNYDLSEIAYGMWHEGFGTEGNVNGVRRYLQGSKYNNPNIKGYFTTTYPIANNILGGYYHGNASWTEAQTIFSDGVIASAHQNFTTTAATPVSPIILDLDGDGVETTAVGAGTYFDQDGNGFAEQTGWAASDDGILVMDRDGNGTIDTGKELFGNETLLNDGTKASNGFQALAELDGNQDGKVDANDSAWNQLKIWQDIDGDGYSTSDEFHTLDELGIQSINTGYTDSTLIDAQGNEHRQVGNFTKTDGTTGTATDVWFKKDTAYTIATEWLDVPEDIAVLPDLQGYGNVYDLHQAMVRDARIDSRGISYQ